jgi:hypothetical protein
MTAFPGSIFDGEGRPLDDRLEDLTTAEMDACAFRAAVQIRPDALSYDGLASVGLIWLLADHAAFSSIPEAIVSATVETALHGRSILILAHLTEIGAEVRDGLLEALEPISAAGAPVGL